MEGWMYKRQKGGKNISREGKGQIKGREFSRGTSFVEREREN